MKIITVRKSLLNSYEKITKLHDEWTILQQSVATETTNFDEYIAKYGDYRESITAAVNQLEQLDYLMNALDHEYSKRNLHIPSDSSDTASHDDNERHWNPTSASVHQSGMIPFSSALHPDPTLLNFVDASILSKLELPTFDGNLLDYPEFWARFATLVDNKSQLDDTTKFSLLKSCLRGRALQSVQGLSLTSANYRIAVDILKTHYDDKVTMRHILFTKLAQLPACDPEGRHLPTLYNRMFSLVRQFCNGYDDSKETALGALLLNKLPLRVRSQIYDRTSNSHNVTPSELLHLLTDIVRKDSTLFEIEYHTRRSADTKHIDYGFHTNARTLRPTSNSATTRSTEEGHTPKKPTKSCPYCNSTLHNAMKCNIFTSIKQRSAQAKVLRLCFNCLSSIHPSKECPSKYSCRYCSKRHHSSLCRQSDPRLPFRALQPHFTSATTNNQEKSVPKRLRPPKPLSHTVNVANSPSPPEAVPVSDTPESALQQEANPGIATYSSSQSLATASPTSQAALMCTQVSLFNPLDSSKRITVTAFLDSGSSKSYITDEAANRLNLPAIAVEDTTISTFGSTNLLKLRCTKHKVGLFTTKGTKHLQVKSVPTLTGDLLQIQFNREIPFESFTFTNCKPSILIGNDYFWDIVLSEDFFYRMLPNGYRLLHTTIGDVIINENLDVAHADVYTSVISNENLDNPRNHDELAELVNNFWKLETVGITDDPTKNDDDDCLNYFNDTIFYDEHQKRYVVKLPFKADPSQLPNNFSLAFSRLRSQIKSLQQRPDYMEKYHAVIANQVQQGIIEEVPPEDLSKPSHYLSHHGVVKRDGKDIKIRCVYDGVNTVEEGREFYKQSKELFQSAGMNLRAYSSNSKELNEHFEINEGCKVSEVQKLLGLQWDIKRDTLFIRLPSQPTSDVKWTKRKVLKHVASVYDPLGLLSPTILLGKIFLQSLWKMELPWDQLLPPECSTNWERISSSWNPPGLCIPRRIFNMDQNSKVEYDLHIFTDASATAYCAAAYLVQRCNDVVSATSLLMSKSRLTPLHHAITIPRLELAAVMIGSKLLTYIVQHLDVRVSRKFLWTDSSVALTWIRCNKDLPIFVKNRVKVILQNTVDVTVRHIPGNVNPADIGSRGATLQELLESTSWWKGPSFLTNDEASWPSDVFNSSENPPAPTYGNIPSVANDESPTKSTECCFTTASEWTSPVLDASRFSSWKKMVNTMVYVLLFIAKKSRKARKYVGNFKATHLWKAEIILFRFAQAESPPSEEHKKQLKLFLCPTTFLWKSKGRIDHATLPQDAITPIFLPRRCCLTDLFVLHVHQTNNHCGVNHTLTILRQSVWIPKGRAAVKRVLYNNCFQCKRNLAKPYSLPPFPCHPQRRVNPPQYPFENVGMDFFGPLQYRTKENTADKYWMILLTCLNSRAIYVDVILDMTASTVLHSLRRFIATFGCPTWIICDNAQSFKTVDQCYASIPDPPIDEDIVDFCATRRIQMKFIPSLSPWQGGIYEKMIDIFKRSFKNATSNRLLELEDIRTIAKEAEAIVNTRPLTYYTDDISFFPLRPIDFVRPHARLNGPQPLEDDDEWMPLETTRDTLLREWSRTSQLVTSFWRRWTQEYLSSLRESFKFDHKRPRSHEENAPKKGDYVIIHDSSLHRGQWKMGEVIGSQDDFKRSVEIRLPSKKVITRPNNLVHKLELHPPETRNQQPSPTNTTRPQPDQDSMQSQRHPMITRSKARFLPNALLLCFVLTLHMVSSLNTRCPEEGANINKTVIYATNCVSKGIAIARYEQLNKYAICWFPVSCPMGHVRFDISAAQTTLCGDECKCPQWTNSCSFSRGSRTTYSELKNIPQHLRDYRPDYVCSFNLTSTCDTTKRIGIFNQIQLYDNSFLIVKDLNVRIKDYIDKNDFVCVDRKGWIRRPNRRVSGTSRFCEQHECHPNARLFCTYDNPLALLVIDESGQEDDYRSIPIKAWGTVMKPYHDYPRTPTAEPKEKITLQIRDATSTFSESEQTMTLSMKCIKGGLLLSTQEAFDVIEACVNDYCVYAKKLTKEAIIFPNSLIMYDYTVSIKAYENDKLRHNGHVSCKAHPICETLRCTFCWKRIYNSQCWTLLETMFFITLPLLSVILIPWLCYITKIIGLLLHIIKFLVCGTVAICKLHRKSPNLRRYTSRRRKLRTRKSSFLPCVISVLSLLHLSKGCSQVVSMNAHEEICIISNDIETCTFNEAMVVTLQPLQQETCIALKDHESQPIGVISVKINGILFQCRRNVEFFTRDHQLVSESVHRCYSAGTCDRSTCENMSPTEKSKEFSFEANNNPGYTFCTPSCGCLTCDGCFLCEKSCLFYRVYAVPTTSTIYTIFTCPSWEIVVTLEATLRQKDSTVSTTIQLHPGQISAWNNLKFSLIGTVVPQLPILSSTFAETDYSISVIKPAHRGQLSPHSAGQLQVFNEGTRRHVNCSFAINACQCTHGLYKASCSCSSGSVADLMQPSPLPLVSKNFKIFSEMISERAELTLYCQSSGTETTANIECPSQTQMALCTSSGYLNILKFHFDTSSVSMICNASCPGGTVSLAVKGVLLYVDDDLIRDNLQSEAKTRDLPRDTTFLSQIPNKFKEFVGKNSRSASN
ncbi:Pao retrotransposon peptidase [Ostertagia ostertagi]